jgi:signal transduction histidine kinase
MCAEMERLRAELEQIHTLARAREDFAVTVSHDYRTALAVILASSEMLARYSDRMTRPQHDQHLTRITQQAQYMHALMEDVMTYSRARAGRIEQRPIRLNIEQVARAVFEAAQIHAKPTHRFAFDCAPDVGEACIDERIVQRILTNIISNAIRYSPAGGDVGLEIRADGDDLVLTVRDQGIGIETDDLPRIFEPFKRGKNIEQIDGTGLGMAIVYEHVRALKGTIHVESALGKGTTVTLRLPHRRDVVPECP